MANTPYSDNHGGTDVAPPPANTKAIWNTFYILLGLTIVEFILAYYFPAGHLRVGIFVVMTIVKAFYIVGEFMHLKHEVKSLIWAILLPILFIAWLLLALMYEGGSIFEVR
jgi:cytochrome c oxidase subunit IV